MLHEFLDANRAELIERCQLKVAHRPAPRPTPNEMAYGIPLFLGQLIDTLRIAQDPDAGEGIEAPGRLASTKRHIPSEIAAGAAKHGSESLRKGFTVDQVVHGYGDLCQAVTELAGDKNVPICTGEFKTLNACLDNAIADAVMEFGWQRDQLISAGSNRALNERLGFLAHEIRNFLSTAMLAFSAIKEGRVAINGATSAVLDRSLTGLRDLVDGALADVRLAAGAPLQLDYLDVAQFIDEVKVGASLEAKGKECEFAVSPPSPGIAVHVDRHLLYSAVSNLLQNAFKFTRIHGRVSLRAYATSERVLIEVQDECGGLPQGMVETMFQPFEQHGADRSGLGLGLSISQRAVEISGGKLGVRDIPGIGCVFTIDLPRVPAIRRIDQRKEATSDRRQ